METNHVAEEDKGIPCLYCDNVSPSRSALRMHVKKHNTNCKEIEFSHFLTKVSTLTDPAVQILEVTNTWYDWTIGGGAR